MIRALVAGFVRALALFISPTSAAPPGDCRSPEQTATQYINVVRAVFGESQLDTSPALTEAAAWMAQDLALRTSRFSHVDSWGRGPYRRAVAFGYPADQGLAENIVIGIEAPEHAVAGWFASGNHRRNLLTSAWNSIGIARYHSESNPWEWFWVVVFGTQEV